MKRPTPFSVRQYNYIENFLNFMGNYREVLSAIWENFRVVLFVIFGLRGGNCSIVCLWLYAGCGICHSPKVKNRSIYQGLPYNCKKTAKQDREGRIHYSEEELIRYMAVSPMMGRRLFPYAENGEHQILLGNRRENRGFSVEKLRSVIQRVMSMALLVLMYTQLDGRFGGRVPMLVFYFYGGSIFLPD